MSYRRLVALLALTAAVLAAGCASLEPPAGRQEQYFCRPDSAVRYRGAADPRAKSIRPAPEHGSCRHQ